MRYARRRMLRQRTDGPRFGIDAPYVLALTSTAGLLGAVGAWAAFASASTELGWVLAAPSAVALLVAGSHVHTTLRGKLMAWEKVLDQLDLAGAERVLDLGCGRGAVLVQVARRLTSGSVVGIDIWRRADQSGNSHAAACGNSVAAGVAPRVKVLTADMTDLPFADGSFDVVLSSMAIHNVRAASGRACAIAEAVRVLRPHGRIAIADLRSGTEYRDCLRRAGITQVRERDLGWRAWWGGPFVPTILVTAEKPPPWTPVRDAEEP